MKINQAFWAALLAIGLVTGCDVNIHLGSSLNSSGNGAETDLKVRLISTNNSMIPNGIKNVVIENHYGAVKLTGLASGPFNWSQTLKVRARTESAAQNMVKTLACRAELSGDSLKLTVNPLESREPGNFQSDLEISVPSAVSVRTHNYYGQTTIMTVTGPVEVTGESGAVTVSHIGGEVHAQTSYASLTVDHTGAATLKDQSGMIDASDIRGPLVAETTYATLAARDISGPVHLRDQSGSVSVDRAGPADVQTSYASLRATEIIGDATLVNQSGGVLASAITGSVKATTSYATMDITGSGANFICNNQSGAIRLHATSARLSQLEARTSYASLEVWLAGNLPAPAIQAHTSYAEVESDFPVLTKPAGADPFAGLPPGTPRLRLENQSGKIRVIRE